jgi:hypothetical protein
MKLTSVYDVEKKEWNTYPSLELWITTNTVHTHVTVLKQFPFKQTLSFTCLIYSSHVVANHSYTEERQDQCQHYWKNKQEPEEVLLSHMI